MNILPHALAKAFSVYVTLDHRYYLANYYPEVSQDWIVESDEIVCLTTLLTGNAFRRSNLQRRFMRAPNLQFFGCLRTIKQLKAQVAKRYKTRSLKTVYQPLYLDSKHKNFFIGLVDDRGVFSDFPVEEY